MSANTDDVLITTKGQVSTGRNDRLGSDDLNNYSNVNSRNYEFCQLLATAKGGRDQPPTNPGVFPLGTYTIVSAYSGKCVDIDAASFADGANIQRHGHAAFRDPAVDPSDPISYKLVNQTSGKCVDVQDWSLDDRGNIQQWACGGNINQSFRFYVPGSSTPTVRR